MSKFAIEYGMKRKAKKMSKGGALLDKHVRQHDELQAKRGESYGKESTGVQSPSYSSGKDRGRSMAGDLVRDSKYYKGADRMAAAKEMHKETLSDLKAMPSPKLLASGGRVSPDANHESMCTSDCISPCEVHEKAEYDPKEEPGVEHNGMAMSEDDKDLNQEEVHAKSEKKSVVDRIMSERGQTLSKGGRVANEMKSNRGTDVLATDDDLEFSYTGANSGDELSDEQEDHDRQDIVSRVMKSRKKRSSMSGMSGYGKSDKSIK